MFTFVYDWTYDWINIETFCVLLFGIWFGYGILAWWLDALCGETGYREHFQSIKRAVKRHQATRRQLIVMMALELYKRKHGELPGQLKTLTPEFMPTVPLDPFNDSDTEGVLKYRRDGESYLLYSLGFNGKDDGGCNDELAYESPSDKTDLNFAAAVRQWVIDEQNDRKQHLKN